MGNIEQCCAEMEIYALKKWATTELYIRQFSNQSEDLMRSFAPGPDTGTLDSSIKSDELSLGIFNIEVKTTIENNINPDTGESAAVYGKAWNDGHFNKFLKQSMPPVQFMETGSEEAYMELLGRLEMLW